MSCYSRFVMRVYQSDTLLRVPPSSALFNHLDLNSGGVKLTDNRAKRF